jgi:hypothetical protein
MDYAVPTAADLPPIEVHHLQTPAPGLPGGFKGAGEAGTAGAPAAILNAVNDALAPFGAVISDQPVTPERVLRALRAAGGEPRIATAGPPCADRAGAPLTPAPGSAAAAPAPTPLW